LGIALLAANVAAAQIPDVRIQIDAIGEFNTQSVGVPQWRYYSVFGTPSVAAIRLSFEPGITAYISERLQRIPHDGDPDQLEQAYVEDEGIWRLGKQVLPFGTTEVFRESVIAARGDLTLPMFGGVPCDVALCDSGTGRQRGIVARAGPTSYGLSIAVGSHFGISGTSLTQIRLPEESPGEGQGWGLALGADVTRRIRKVRLCAEGILLREGAGPLDPDLELVDISAQLPAAPFDSFTVGYTRILNQDLQFFRFMTAVPLLDHVTLNPYVRYRGDRLWNLGFEVRVRF
jgi:hypothetical protein